MSEALARLLTFPKSGTRIKNTSDWPDEFVRVVVPWILKAAGISRDKYYEAVIRAPRSSYDPGWRKLGSASRRLWWGRGGESGQTSYVGRHGYRQDEVRVSTDSRMKHATPHSLVGPLEVFVYLIAHEAYHATKGKPGKFLKNGKINAASMEWWCNHWAYQTVEKFREEWPTRLRPKVKAALRKKHNARRAKRRAADRVVAAREHRATDQYRLKLAQRHLRDWQRKRKLAATKIKKYREQIRHLDRKAAKKGAGS
jgi:hypothetical protein